MHLLESITKATEELMQNGISNYYKNSEREINFPSKKEINFTEKQKLCFN